MSFALTPNFGLHVIDYNTEKDTWGSLYNADMAAIDAALGAMGETKIAAGVNVSANFALALPTAFNAYRLRLFDCRSTSSKAYAKLSVDGSTYLGGTSYEFVRRDASNQGGFTAGGEGSAGAAAFLLTDTLKAQGSSTAESASIDLVLSTLQNFPSGAFVANLEAVASYKNAGGYMTRSDLAGALIAPAARPTHIKLGGSGSSFGDALLCRYVLTGIRNVAA